MGTVLRGVGEEWVIDVRNQGGCEAPGRAGGRGIETFDRSSIMNDDG